MWDPTDWVVLLTSFGVSTASLLVLIRLLRRNRILDTPGPRSLHEQPVPRGGGIALAIGVIAGLLAAGDVPWPIWVAIVGFTAIGVWDDLRPRSAISRLIGQLIIAMLVALGVSQIEGPTFLAVVIGLFILVASLNAVNFMDGVNGITALHAILWGVTYLIALQMIGLDLLVPLSITLLAAGLAFLPWNSINARIFLGDSGSYLIGGSVGLLAVGGVLAGYPLAFIGPLATYAADTGFALVRKVIRGQRLSEPHRNHVFQQLVLLGRSHSQTAVITLAFSLVSSVLALATLGNSHQTQVVLLGCIVLINMVYLALPTLLKRKSIDLTQEDSA